MLMPKILYHFKVVGKYELQVLIRMPHFNPQDAP